MKIYLVIFLLPFSSLSQSYKVRDYKSKQPVPFVNIWIKGSQSGTTSNENGTFELGMKSMD